MRNKEDRVVAVLDGDQKSRFKDNYAHALSMTEGKDGGFETYFGERVGYMPGDSWPESWLVSTAATCVTEVCAALKCDQDALQDALEYGLQAGKHNELFEISNHLGLERAACLQGLAMAVAMWKPETLAEPLEFIHATLRTGG